jgi:UDP-N-acetylmuramate: L-alanyl-gamma-D-glutamyl-meso-diaminopimelate ligase
MNENQYYLEKLERFEDKGDRIFDRPEVPTNPKSFHIVGICGTAMGSLAGLLSEKGFKVKGSDQVCHPPISTMLESLDVELHTGNYEKDNIGDVDVVVIGNVSRPHNPEAKFARENSLPQVTLPEALRDFVFEDTKRLVVAGTHGKTTTTGILSHIFEVAGKEPGFMIGGVPQGKEKSFALGKGDYSIFEGDEYDTAYFDKKPKFLHYKPTIAIITSIELDHLDIYDDWDDYKQAFIFFAESLPEDGLLILNDSYDVMKEIAEHAKCKTVFYGENSDATYKNLKSENGEQTFDLIIKGELLGEISTPLSGVHNVLNIVASCTLSLSEGIPFEDIQKAVKTFHGMRRRQEVVADVDGILVIDDFAHHPTAVKTTIDGIKEKYPDKRLIALFEPATNTSRRKIFEQEYMESFDKADAVCLKLPKLKEGDDASEYMDGDNVVSGIINRGTPATFYKTADNLLEDLVSTLKQDDLVLIMTNGTFDGVKGKLVERLEKWV